MIDVSKVSLRYGSPARDELATKTVLSQVDLSVLDGEFVCVLGPSGCGKTTLLNLIAGFLAPTSGTVSVHGHDVDEADPSRGVVFQTESALFDWLTVTDNVAFGPRSKGLERSRIQDLVNESLALVGLSEHGHKYPRELSGGMQQRVQIARVLVNDPEVLLMDEPFAALDSYTRLRMQEELERIWQETGKAVLFVTHDIGEAIRLSDRVVVLSAGPGSRVKASIPIDLGRPRLRLTAEFSELFNEIDGLIREEAQV